MIVGYESALNYWRNIRVAHEGRSVAEPAGKTYGARALSVSERAGLALDLCDSEAPLEVVLRGREGRHGAARVEDHVWRGPLTDEHLVGLGDDISVCRMPVVFCQLASSWDTIELAELACEMAGAYALTPWSNEGSAGDVEPLASLADLQGYAKAARALRVRGAVRALSALALAVERSNSPRETSVAIFFLQSRARGGAGLVGFAMNKRIDLPDRLAEAFGQKTIVPDFSWENGTVVEYDSTQEHLSPAARARDEAKRRMYQDEGMDCLTLTNGILRSNALLDHFVSDLERSLGLSRRPPSARMAQSRRDLRERLFGTESQEAALKELSGGALGS